ncbi:hypothetical protein [Actinomadura sp. SCN-SB]|uniref:hypothetical protein n=1 Tax=Actinomadura sp. SCN-SB TaxID=3373092 RepID=UPI003751A6AB
MVTDTDGRTSERAFFRHAASVAGAENRPLQNDTRYLAAAMYLDRRLCESVIHEYIDDDGHRAVAPSFGFDVRPVILHALRARRLRLCRDLALCAVGLLAAVLVPWLAILFVWLALSAAGVMRIAPRFVRRLGLPITLSMLLLLLLVVIPAVLTALGPVFAVLDLFFSGADEYRDFEPEDVETGFRAFVAGLAGVLVVLALIAALPAIYMVHLWMVFRTLYALGPGAVGPGPPTQSERARRILDRVGPAQHGNVTLYSGENPFLGSGDIRAPWAHVWSIALDIDRPASGGLLSKEPAKSAERVDPVVMHERVRDRIREMRDETATRSRTPPLPPLPPNERLSGLVADMHIVGRGECTQRRRVLSPGIGRPFDGHPLIDATWSKAPYSVATPEAIDAIVRHPQAGLRCFQRITIDMPGQAVLAPGGHAVAPAEDEGLALSAFIHLALEGRMLYGQFAATVLPPVRYEFRVVDRLSTGRPGKMFLLYLTTTWRALPGSLVRAFPDAVRTCWRMLRSAVLASLAPDPTTDPVHDYGARISVRELASEQDFETFVQELDVDKYIRFLEHRVNEALLDYLGEECGIDVSAYREQVGVILNQGVIMTGGTVKGQVAVGARVKQTQHGHGRGINP